MPEVVDFTKFCVLSGVKDNLNTKMDIEYNGKIYKVAVCDQLSEEASIRSIKNKLTDYAIEIDNLIARANELGLYVSLTPPQQQRQQRMEQPLAAVSPTQADKPTKDCLACKGDGKVKVAGKDGVQESNCKKCNGTGTRFVPPKQVAVKVVDENGREQQLEFDSGAADSADGISIVQTSDKQIANKHSVDQSYGNGYAVKDCSPCRGTGKVRMSGRNGVQEIPCKKCNGTGIT